MLHTINNSGQYILLYEVMLKAWS